MFHVFLVEKMTTQKYSSFKGAVHSNLKFHPLLLALISMEVYVIIPEFHGGKEFSPVEAYCGQGLQPTN